LKNAAGPQGIAASAQIFTVYITVGKNNCYCIVSLAHLKKFVHSYVSLLLFGHIFICCCFFYIEKVISREARDDSGILMSDFESGTYVLYIVGTVLRNPIRYASEMFLS
jgi:hypothetical protein